MGQPPLASPLGLRAATNHLVDVRRGFGIVVCAPIARGTLMLGMSHEPVGVLCLSQDSSFRL